MALINILLSLNESESSSEVDDKDSNFKDTTFLTDEDKKLLLNSTYENFKIIERSQYEAGLKTMIDTVNMDLSVDLAMYCNVDVEIINAHPQIAKFNGIFLENFLRGVGLGYKIYKATVKQFGALSNRNKNVSSDALRVWKSIDRKDNDIEVLFGKSPNSSEVERMIMIWKSSPDYNKYKTYWDRLYPN